MRTELPRQMLTVDSVIAELLKRGWLTVNDILRVGVEAVDLKRRNPNVRVSLADGSRGWMIKQAEASPLDRARLDREAEFYRYCNERALLRAHVPRLIGADAEGGAIFLDWISGFPSIHDLYASLSTSDLGVLGQEVGNAIVAMRGATAAFVPFLDRLGAEPPGVLSLHEPTPAALWDLSPAILEIVRIVQSESATTASLDALREAWEADCLQHGDMKGDNLVVSRGRQPRIAVVDWEGVQRGDGAWDLAGLFQDVLTTWLHSMEVREGDPEAYVSRAALRIERTFPYSRALWSTYRRALASEEGDADAFLRRAFGFTGARLLQTAVEASATSERLHKQTVAMLQLATNVLSAPLDAAAALFGLVP